MRNKRYYQEAFVLLLVMLLVAYLAAACRQQPQYSSYRLVTKDGKVLSHTEVMPTPGDQYWDAASDTWYVVVDVQGDTGIMLPEPEARPILRAQQLRRIGLGLVAAFTLLLVLRRLRRR